MINLIPAILGAMVLLLAPFFVYGQSRGPVRICPENHHAIFDNDRVRVRVLRDA